MEHDLVQGYDNLPDHIKERDRRINSPEGLPVVVVSYKPDGTVERRPARKFSLREVYSLPEVEPIEEGTEN